MNKKYPVWMALLCAVVMVLAAACGGGEESTATPPEAAPTEVAAVAPEAAEEVAEEVPTAAPEPTEAAPTAVPEPTAAPTEAPAAELAALPEGPCANPYFPVVNGARYTYQTEVPEMGPTTATFAFANVTENSFDMALLDGEDTIVTYTWQCLEDGLQSPLMQFNSGPDVVIETVEASGVTLPAPEDLEVGYTWNTRLVYRTYIGDENTGIMQMDQTMEMVNEVVAIEPIETAYGAFDEALKIQATGTLEIATTMGDTVLPASSINTTGITWFVKDIGRVRSEDYTDFFGTGEDVAAIVTELIAIEMP